MNRQSLGNDASDESSRYGQEARGSRRLSPHDRSVRRSPAGGLTPGAGADIERGGFLQGPPRVWVEQLTELTLVHGISGYILYRAESGDVIRTFADEVAPAVRSAVSTERARQRMVGSDRCQK